MKRKTGDRKKNIVESVAESRWALLRCSSVARKPARIGFKTLLVHMQGMEQRLRSEFKEGLQVLDRKIDTLEKKTSERFDSLDRKLEWVSLSLTNIDERLDDLEVVQLPKLKKAVGIQ